jgi:hypothetical protein
MTNLRDWQKRASERRDNINPCGDEDAIGAFVDGFDSRAAEIDLLLQIIEKQSEALTQISNDKNKTIASDSQEFMDGAYTAFGRNAELADETQAEVQGLVEKLVKDV